MPDNDYRLDGGYGRLNESGFNPPRRVEPIMHLPLENNLIHREDDIEVIDLDDSRDQIKPTTWH